METPSSNRRITRSQTLLAAASNSKNSSIPISKKSEESEISYSKSRQRSGKNQQDRSALIDITNDSPIGGLASGTMETPSSYISKQRNNRVKMMTPGSGEALLRGQVKTLLKKVEEETGHFKPSFESHPLLGLRNFVNSPLSLLAPTPANTPQVSDMSVTPQTFPVIGGDQIKISQEVNELFDVKKQDSPLSRSLLLDFSEKSDSSEYSSVLTNEGRIGENTSTDDDNASIWSIQVNASNKDEDEVDEIEDEDDEEEYKEEEEEGDYDEEDYDELCQGMNNVSIRNEEKSIRAQFIGKHTRFEYNSDDEIIEEEEEKEEEEETVTPGVMRLNGLPTPQGKHLRFTEEES